MGTILFKIKFIFNKIYLFLSEYFMVEADEAFI
jgi:hypothetical protein